MSQVRWEILEGAEMGPYGTLSATMEPGKPEFLLVKLVNTGDESLRQLWAEGDPWSPLQVMVKSGKDSGVWREAFFVGDLDPGESRVMYVRVFAPWFSVGGPHRMKLNVREKWQR